MSSGLPWFRMDSDFASNPKVAEMIADHGQRGMAAAFVFVAAIGHCSLHLTDGQVGKGALPLLHASAAHMRLLVEYGLVETAEKGWILPGFAGSQPTRDTAEAEAKRRSDAGRKAANARWHKDD